MRSIYLIAGFAFCIMLSSCTEETTTTAFTDQAKQGGWYISSFNDNGRDVAFPFKGYKIHFTVDDVVSASGINFFTGHWNEKTVNGQTMLYMNWGETPAFELMNKDWQVTSYSAEQISLQFQGNSTASLTFTKLQ